MDIILILALGGLTPLILWYILRVKTQLTHFALSYIAILVYIGTFMLGNWIDGTFFTPDTVKACNDCVQGNGLAIAVYSTPISVAYLLAALGLTVNFMWRKIKRSR